MYHDWVANFERNGAEGFLNRKLAAGANDYSIKNEFLFFLTDSEILAFRKIGKELFFGGGFLFIASRLLERVFCIVLGLYERACACGHHIKAKNTFLRPRCEKV